MKNMDNPHVHLSGAVSQLELKNGYWVSCVLKGNYDSKSMEHKKTSVVQVMVDEDTEEFYVILDKKVNIRYWDKNGCYKK